MTDDLFGDLVPHARTTDPETSHAAAGSVEELTEKRRAVLDLFRREGAMTDEDVAERYAGIPQSPSGLRTRRCELVDLGFVRDSGERRRLESGRHAIVWTLRDSPARRLRVVRDSRGASPEAAARAIQRGRDVRVSAAGLEILGGSA